MIFNFAISLHAKSMRFSRLFVQRLLEQAGIRHTTRNDFETYTDDYE